MKLMARIETFEDIVAWQKGQQLFIELYKLLNTSHHYFYKDQILRATLSITNNIAEGFDRNSPGELKHFLGIARGSAAEVRSMLLLGQNTSILSPAITADLLSIAKDISRLLTGFIKSLDRQQTTGYR